MENTPKKKYKYKTKAIQLPDGTRQVPPGQDTRRTGRESPQSTDPGQFRRRYLQRGDIWPLRPDVVRHLQKTVPA